MVTAAAVAETIQPQHRSLLVNDTGFISAFQFTESSAVHILAGARREAMLSGEKEA